MKKIIKALRLPFTFLLLVASFIACDEDYNTIESAVLGKDNANFNTSSEIIPISAYNKKLSALQINGLSSNLLGVFNDPEYGKTTASIITQVTPRSFDTNFGENPEIDQVVLSIPYYSKITGTDTEGNTTYALDSLYGNPEASIKLSIYQNTYFLTDFNPYEIGSTQNYYSNSNSNQNSVLNSAVNSINFDDHIGDLLFDEEVTPSANAIVTTTGTGDDEVETRSVPALRLVLENNAFWKTMILDKQGEPELSNASEFNNYFRGLYFKADAVNNDGSMALINLGATAANITITYSKGPDNARTQSVYILDFSGNRLNTFINDYNLVTFPASPNKELGDQKLYLKGAEGSMAVVDLFAGMVECDHDDDVTTDPISMPALDCFLKTYRQLDENGEYLPKVNGRRPLKKLINDAQLVVYEDQTSTTSQEKYHRYDRIYAYDIKNNIPIIDYVFDPIENTTAPFSSKIISLSQRDTIAKRYKINLTEHLNNILLRDSTNTKIGLVLSTNVNQTINAQILNSNDDVTTIPAAAILTPRGTILHGSNENVTLEKRMKLNVFFTKPE